MSASPHRINSATASAKIPQLPSKASEQHPADILKQESAPLKSILEYQDMAPAPSQSFYQIALYPYKGSESRRERRMSRQTTSPLSRELPELTQEKLARGCIIIREWPRKRFSQGWTREGAVNPCEIVLELSDFVNGEMDSHIVNIFGQQRYDNLIQAAKKELEVKRKD